MKKVVIIGAGPGGLTAGLILASKGYDVSIFEKNITVGGRNSQLVHGDYKFDLGPTFLMYIEILENVFNLSGYDLYKELEITRLDPIYNLILPDGTRMQPSCDSSKTSKIIEKLFPSEGESYNKYIQKENHSFKYLQPVLHGKFDSIWDFFTIKFLKLIPYLDLHKSLYDRLSGFFKNENLKMSMSFQSKYLGMSPWECPAVYSLISYLEHFHGIFHVKGGLNHISKKMSELFLDKGGKLYLNSSVEKILSTNGKANGIQLVTGEIINSDYVIMNADFAYGMKNFLDNDKRKKYSDNYLSKKSYSCSAIMLYLGLDTKFENIPHHNIIFNKDYKEYITKITKFEDIGLDFSFYLHNPSLIDPTYAPEGHSGMYILIPAPNNNSKINRSTDKLQQIENKVYQIIKEKFNIDDFESHIKSKTILSPSDWEKNYNIYLGAVFNLSHSVSQMLYFRPHNKSQELENLYIVGGGTHPGSGLPTIYQSGIISAKFILNQDGLDL